jgi:hypothetical protein
VAADLAEQDRHQATAPRQVDRLGEAVAPEGVEHDVGLLDAAQRGPGVVDDVVSTQAADEVDLAGAGRGHHVRASCLGDLDRDVADAAARGLDEHPGPGADVRDLHQRLPRGQSDQRQGGGCLVVEPVGDASEVGGRGDDELGVGGRRIGEARHAQHPVTDLETLYAPADRAYHSGDVPPHGERRLAEDGEVPGSDVGVDRVDPDRCDGDEDVALSDSRGRRLGDLEDLRTTEGPLSDHLHGTAPSRSLTPI